MRISLILELLLIFILLAFCASKSVGPKTTIKGIANRNRQNAQIQTPVVPDNVGQIPQPAIPSPVAPVVLSPVAAPVQSVASPMRYCSCSNILCNCCREFSLPLLNLRGPGCASLQYLNGDRMAISMSFADRVLTNTTLSGRRPQPVCMPLPGGVSRFCGRVYNIGRDGEAFKACLGLELRALSDLEAAVRVSCFRFSPDGVRVEPAQPLPVLENEEEDEDDDDDDDDDDDEDDDDDDDDDDIDFDDDDDDDDEGTNDIDAVDYTPFSVFSGLFDDESDSERPERPVTKKTIVVPSTTKRPPVKVVTKAPVRVVTKAPVRAVTNRVKRISTPAPITKVTTKAPKPTTKKSNIRRTTSATTTTTNTPAPTKPTATPTTTTTVQPITTSSTHRPHKRNKPKRRPTSTTTSTSTTTTPAPTTQEPTTVPPTTPSTTTTQAPSTTALPAKSELVLLNTQSILSPIVIDTVPVVQEISESSLSMTPTAVMENVEQNIIPVDEIVIKEDIIASTENSVNSPLMSTEISPDDVQPTDSAPTRFVLLPTLSNDNINDNMEKIGSAQAVVDAVENVLNNSENDVNNNGQPDGTTLRVENLQR